MEGNKRAKYAYDSDDDDITQVVIHQYLQMSAAVMMDVSDSDEESDDGLHPKDDRRHAHKKNCRKSRRKFNHKLAKKLIDINYLGPVPLFDDKQFQRMLRISRSRFQRIFEDVGRSGIRFFTYERENGPSMEAKLMLPLKTLTLAYGVATHTFSDFFQMSPEFCRQCCLEFDQAFKNVYLLEYLRRPDKDDLESIVKLHKDKHKVEGMFGSIDCSHTVWKNCPKAWQGSFKGKEKKSTIVLEALCDYNLWFWHASYGFAGTLNDKSILNRSGLVDAFTDGTFAEVEAAANVVPFSIGDEEFDKLFCLADGIYPNMSRIVKGIKEPITPAECYYTAWQEGARKDIERAFGVLQGSFKFTTHPIQMFHLREISARMATCLMLHNMKVADRIHQGDVRARYRPAHGVNVERAEVEIMMGHDEMSIAYEDEADDGDEADAEVIDDGATDYEALNDNSNNAETTVPDQSAIYVSHWIALTDEAVHATLHAALLNKFQGSSS